MEKKTEEEVKLCYITPAITSSWNAETQVRMEYYFTKGQITVDDKIVMRGEKKSADYVLFYKPYIPLAVVEAKDNVHRVGDGLQQGIGYAIILNVPFVYSSNGNGFVEHDMLTGKERHIKLKDFPTPEELWNRFVTAKNYNKEELKIIEQDYHFTGAKEPRYYQQIAVNNAVEAIARGQKRILLVMATGTGKTYTAFQIISRAISSGAKKKILYLADRNILIDQSISQDFKPFEKIITKIQNKKIDTSYQIYMGLYQQLAGEDGEEPFREIKPSFFDLIIVDECHRGSAKEDSQWRTILNYFDNATQIGMTATPKETREVSSSTYFGEPVYVYSLKQGIEDGFLAPFKVIRVGTNVDLEGWRPYIGQEDIYGKEIEDREYKTNDIDRKVILLPRDIIVAKRITNHLKETNRYDKTIVFCVDVDHAERMRMALVNENSDIVSQYPNYVMCITGDNPEGKKKLEYFIDPDEPIPTIVTTSKLLTTGVDVKTCKLIVLENTIKSMTEFKQIIGRGTRIYDKPPYNKTYFTIMDFRGATSLFADPDFDGMPVKVVVKDLEEDDIKSVEEDNENPVIPDFVIINDVPDALKYEKKYVVDGVCVEILNEQVQYLGGDGKIINENFIDFTKKNILKVYPTSEDFIYSWRIKDRKESIIGELKEKGVLCDALKEQSGNEYDDFDLICHFAFGKQLLTKKERAENVRISEYLSKYDGIPLKVLSALIDKYVDSGITQVEDSSVLSLDPIRLIASPQKIISAFGGIEKYFSEVKGLSQQIYATA